MSEWVKVCSVDQIPSGSKLLVLVGGRAVGVFNVDGSYYAIDDVCTHDGGPLVEGLFSGHEIQCPRHGARFDVRTGKALCFPAFTPVACHQVKIESGEVFVVID